MSAYQGTAIASATSHETGERTTRTIRPHGAPTTPHEAATTAGTTAARGPFASSPTPTLAPSPAACRRLGVDSPRHPNQHAHAIDAASGMSMVTVREKANPAND